MKKYCLHCGRGMLSANPDKFCSMKCAELVKRLNEFMRVKLEEGVIKAQMAVKRRALHEESSKAYAENWFKKKKFPCYLIIPDQHLPYENRYSLRFYSELQREYKIPNENVLCLGDFRDEYFANMHEVGPDMEHTPNEEIDETLERSKQWYKVFPKMKMILGNHETRVFRKANSIGLPSQLFKKYEELYETPPGWEVRKDFMIFGEHSPFMCVHGEKLRDAADGALHMGVNLAMGHLHSKAGTSWIKTANQELWGLDAGCGIQPEAYAYKYGQDSKKKPILGGGVVHNGGEYASFVPL